MSITARRLGCGMWFLVLCACRSQSPRADTSRTAVVSPICTDSDEVRAIACSGGSARRVAETLFVRLDSGIDKAFRNRGGEADVTYQYAGRLGRPPFHLIEVVGGERPPRWKFLNGRSGDEIEADDQLLMSPDSTRFVTPGTWGDCDDLGDAGMVMWQLTDRIPVMTWGITTWHCQPESGWGPSDLHWRTSDTLEFIRNERVEGDTLGKRRKRSMLLVHEPTGWHIIPR